MDKTEGHRLKDGQTRPFINMINGGIPKHFGYIVPIISRHTVNMSGDKLHNETPDVLNIYLVHK